MERDRTVVNYVNKIINELLDLANPLIHRRYLLVMMIVDDVAPLNAMVMITFTCHTDVYKRQVVTSTLSRRQQRQMCIRDRL